MRLTDLDPHWIANDGRHGQGIRFNCLLHPTAAYSCCAIFFTNPIDGREPVPSTREDGSKRTLWQRTGETFDDLTLHPSVDGSGEGCWHGWIRKGEVTHV